MYKDRRFISIFALSICGVLFAGYLTFTKLVLGICALNEPCPIVFGKPACVYGLVLYSALLILSSILLFGKSIDAAKRLVSWLIGVSGFGVLFAGYFTFKEIFYPACPLGECNYALVLPSCAWGFVMYIAILVIAIFSYRQAIKKLYLSKKDVSQKGKPGSRIAFDDK